MKTVEQARKAQADGADYLGAGAGNQPVSQCILLVKVMIAALLIASVHQPKVIVVVECRSTLRSLPKVLHKQAHCRTGVGA